MFQSIKLRTLIAAVIILAAVYCLLPTLYPSLPASVKPYFLKNRIHLGLDLQGGMHLVLEVDTEKAMEGTVERLANALKEALMEKRIRFRSVERKADNSISVELPSRESRADLEKILSDQFPDLEIKSAEAVEGREKVTLKFQRKADRRHEEDNPRPEPRDDPQPRGPVRRDGARDHPPGRRPDPDPAARDQGPEAGHRPDRQDGPSRVQARRRGAQPRGCPAGKCPRRLNPDEGRPGKGEKRPQGDGIRCTS